MSQDTNVATVLGAIAREAKTRQNGETLFADFVIAGYERVTGRDGKERNLPFYQQVSVIGKEAEEAMKLAVGTPVLAIGSLRERKYEVNGEKKSTTFVKAQTLRAVHGIPAERTVASADGSHFLLQDGYASVLITCRVTREVDIAKDFRKTNDGGTVLNLSAATNDEWKNADGEKQEHTNWLRLKAWDELAEHFFNLGVTKGTSLLIRGRIENGSYEKDGKKVYTADINLGSDLAAALPVGRRAEQASADSIPSGTVSASRSVSIADVPELPVFEEEEALPF